MKLGDFCSEVKLSEDQVRLIAKEIGKEIPANKHVINKQLATDIKKAAKEKTTSAKAEKSVKQLFAAKKEVKLEKTSKPVKQAPVVVKKFVAPAPVKVEAPVQSGIPIPPFVVVKDFAEKIDIPVTKIISHLIKDGFMINMNETIDYEIAHLIADELGIEICLDEAAKEKQDYYSGDLKNLLEEDQKNGVLRAPIISVMGHVDHGKTSLLDYYRSENVVSGEAGGITQSIGAYQVHLNERNITFIDTPGHEAFIAMRRRGVQSTDIAILVVASNEGVKSQTKEAISHAKEANIPMIVAITKSDLEQANPEKVKTELSELGMIPEEWGGDVMMIEVSVMNKTGVDDLLESILLQADMMELKANSARGAIGSVIESNIDAQLGKIATVLIHTGTLKIRDFFVIGAAYGKIRTLFNDHGKQIKKAGPAMPVMITGLKDVPEVGDILKVVPNEKLAKKTAAEVAVQREKDSASTTDFNLDFITSKVKEDNFKGIKIVLKADTIGSLEAVKDGLKKIKTDNARVKIVRARTGMITQSDVLLAQAAGAVIIGFTTEFSSKDVRNEAKVREVEFFKYNIIYKLIEDTAQLMVSSLEPEFEDIDLGVFTAKKVFLTEKSFMIVGGKVTEGKVQENAKIKVFRKGKQVTAGRISKVQRGTNQVKEVEKGDECGVQFESSFRLIDGDELHLYKTIKKKIQLQKI